MCRKGDELFARLERAADELEELTTALLQAGMLPNIEVEGVLDSAQSTLDDLAKIRLASWAEKNNANPRLF